MARAAAILTGRNIAAALRRNTWGPMATMARAKCGRQLVVAAGIIGGELGDQPSRGDQLARVPRTTFWATARRCFSTTSPVRSSSAHWSITPTRQPK